MEGSLCFPGTGRMARGRWPYCLAQLFQMGISHEPSIKQHLKSSTDYHSNCQWIEFTVQEHLAWTKAENTDFVGWRYTTWNFRAKYPSSPKIWERPRFLQKLPPNFTFTVTEYKLSSCLRILQSVPQYCSFQDRS